jgi:uncharacterized protein (TIGR03435 family)
MSEDLSQGTGRTSTLHSYGPVCLAGIALIAVSVNLIVSLPVSADEQTPVGTTAAAQAAPTSPVQFDAASVKQNTSGDFRRGFGPAPGGRFTATNVPLRDLIAFAYGVPNGRANLQVVGGPKWLESDRFDVNAVAAGGEIPRGQAGPMVRALLEDRFHLKVHRETRQLPIYNLVMDRGDGQLGPRLRRSSIDCVARRAARGQGAPPPPAPQGPPPDPTTIRPVCGLRLNPGRFAGDAVPIAQLAEGIGPFVQRLVVDRTGLEGYFDIDLEWTPEQTATPPDGRPEVAADPNGPGIFTAIREQLGVKLDSATGPVDVVVIDSLDTLTPN